jgi:hypothetical protein
MRISSYLFLLVLLITAFCGDVYSQQTLIGNNYKVEKGLPHLKIERAMIYSPQNNWLYNHHPSITHFKGKLIAIWSDGLIGEDSPGQRVVYSVSSDFKRWSPMRVLANPSKGDADTLNVLTAAGFYRFKDTLVAYYGEYEQHRTHTRLWARYTTDGEHWSGPVDMHIPLIPNHGPQPTNTGRLIISGNFSFPFTDDHTGLSGWKMASFYPAHFYTQDNSATFYDPAKKWGLPPLCEGSFFQTDDNVLHMLLRVTGKGWKGHLWLTESNNDGATWSKPLETAFTDNDSKFHFGRLPDKQFYYVGIPDTLHHYERNPLVLALSNDGKYFNRQYVIADELYKLKQEGLYKGGQYGYPHTMIWQGSMYVIISRQKESIEVIRFKLDQL